MKIEHCDMTDRKMVLFLRDTLQFQSGILEKLKERIDALERKVPPLEAPTEGLSIGEAIFWLKKGYHVTRDCWKNPKIYLWLHEGSFTRGSEIRVFTIRGVDCIWSPNHDELLADDWRVLKDDLKTK